ncbi:hypothetical protein [Jhaorihella thermophila]|uniref:Tetratricopeptide repeat-like domain-containing protein n=1 Tax=Jhaorihella thermophila TaxID=488547 RepID=A0A1H5WUT2_9RHOB|nr:hypothetical protein [Jhaorihella thermophila]SEG03231.1 hypothetical protein SAMN05421751_10923 [Jhaorihella thermophila]
MSEIDHFIEEVTEEVRRDRLFALYRKYGWIVALIIVLIVGGAAWNEYRKAQQVAAAQQLGDAIIAALSVDDPAGRAEALAGVQAATPGGDAVRRMLLATALANSGRLEQAVAELDAIAANGELEEIYRQLARFKALTLQADTLPAADRRAGFEALATAGLPLRLLAEEQLALIDIEEGKAEEAIARLERIRQDSEVTQALQDRATQLIVALGGEPADLSARQTG